MLSACYSLVCLPAPHTQCFMQCSVYNDASLVFVMRVCYILVGTTLCIFPVQGHFGLSLLLQGATFELRLAVGMRE